MMKHETTTNYISLLVIALCLPFIVWGVCAILPTFDDYTTLQSPWWVQIAPTGFFFADAVRRPFDALLGYVVGCHPVLFPTLNHVLIVLGHAISTVLVFTLCRQLALKPLATNIATLFFFFSPATLGATLACDGFNQTYAQLWGLLALYVYLQASENRARPHAADVSRPHAADVSRPRAANVSRPRAADVSRPHAADVSRPHAAANFSLFTIPFYLLCLVMATLSKENGLAWAVLPPIIGYAFGRVSGRLALRHIGNGMVIALAYFAIYFTIYQSGVLNLEYDEQYTEVTMASHLKDFLQLMAYTWVPADYMSIVYPPTRNMALAATTVVISLPFLVLLALKALKVLRPTGTQDRKSRNCLLLLILCFFIVVSPHLVTLVSIMHNYASLSMAALIVAYIVNETSWQNDKRPCRAWKPNLLTTTFLFFLAAAVFTDLHHYVAARQSGLLGRQMALQAINQAERPVEHAFCISIDDDMEPRYSSFCVRPVDAFAWGLSVRHYSHYTWQTIITEAKLPRYDRQQVDALADSALQAGNEEVWVAGGPQDHLVIITPSTISTEPPTSDTLHH